MSADDVDALKALIGTVPALTGRVAVTTVRSPDGAEPLAPPYAVLHPSTGRNTAERTTGHRAVENPTFTIHVVAHDGDQLTILVDLLRNVLFPGGRGIKITTPGRINDRLWLEQPVPQQTDDNVKPSLVFAILRCGWRSQPA